MLFKLLLISTLLIAFIFQLASLQEETEEEKRKNCGFLNSIRANFTVCCQYPQVVVWIWQLVACARECKQVKVISEKICCLNLCSYRMLNILEPHINEDGSQGRATIIVDGIHDAFLLSVGNDTRWAPVVRTAVDRCYEDLIGVDDGYSCDIIPKNLYMIIDCCYNENFLKCPTWNPHNLKECQYTYDYISKCSD